MKLGKCLKNSLDAIDKDPSLRLVKGPPGQEGDTSHFWTIDKEGNVFDPTPEAVNADYEYNGRIVNHKEVRKELEETTMDVSKFREELRAKLEGQYNTARRGMGLPDDEFTMEEDSNQILKQISDLKRKKASMDMKIANLQKKLANEQGKEAPQEDPSQNDPSQDQMGIDSMNRQAFSDDIDYLDEGDEDISAQQGKNLLKFATADKIAASIMNMDDMELANFIDNGLKQAGVQVIADNLETSGGGTPVEAEPQSSVPAPQNGAQVAGDNTGGQEGNMRLADL